jgi:hypothetical protein
MLQSNLNTDHKIDDTNEKTKNKREGFNTIIINNNINNYHYNLNFNNFNENCLSKKRRRLSSFDNFLNLFSEGRDAFNSTLKKTFDEKEYEDNFEFAFKNIKHDFDCEKDILDDIVILTGEDSSSNSRTTSSRNGSFIPIFEEMMTKFDKEIKVKSILTFRERTPLIIIIMLIMIFRKTLMCLIFSMDNIINACLFLSSL